MLLLRFEDGAAAFGYSIGVSAVRLVRVIRTIDETDIAAEMKRDRVVDVPLDDYVGRGEL